MCAASCRSAAGCRRCFCAGNGGAQPLLDDKQLYSRSDWAEPKTPQLLCGPVRDGDDFLSGLRHSILVRRELLVGPGAGRTPCSTAGRTSRRRRTAQCAGAATTSARSTPPHGAAFFERSAPNRCGGDPSPKRCSEGCGRFSSPTLEIAAPCWLPLFQFFGSAHRAGSRRHRSQPYLHLHLVQWVAGIKKTGLRGTPPFRLSLSTHPSPIPRRGFLAPRSKVRAGPKDFREKR